MKTLVFVFMLLLTAGCSMDLSVEDLSRRGPASVPPLIAIDGGLAPVAGETITTSNGYKVRASIGEILPDETVPVMPAGWTVQGVIHE